MGSSDSKTRWSAKHAVSDSETLSAPEAMGLRLTNHAKDRMVGRRLSTTAVSATLDYGRTLHLRGAEIHFLGRREVRKHYRLGVDLSHLEGLMVVCSNEGVILTVYRNKQTPNLRERTPRRRKRREHY